MCVCFISLLLNALFCRSAGRRYNIRGRVFVVLRVACNEREIVTYIIIIIGTTKQVLGFNELQGTVYYTYFFLVFHNNIIIMLPQQGSSIRLLWFCPHHHVHLYIPVLQSGSRPQVWLFPL